MKDIETSKVGLSGNSILTFPIGDRCQSVATVTMKGFIIVSNISFTLDIYV